MDDFLEKLRATVLPPASDLSKLIERREAIIRELAENGVEPTGGVGNGSVEAKRETIRSWLSARGWDYDIFPPRISWSGEDTVVEANLQIPSLISSLHFTHYVLEGTTLSMTFEYNLLDGEATGVRRSFNVAQKLDGLNVDVSFVYSGNSLEVTFNFGAALPLNDHSHMDIGASVTVSDDNPGYSVRSALTSNKGGVIRRIRSELGVSGNGATARWFGSLKLGDNADVGDDIVFPLPVSSGAAALPSLNIYLKFRL